MLLNIILKRIFWILLLVLLGISCSNDIPFDSDKWKQKGMEWQVTEIRQNMLQDLLKSDTLLRKNREEVIKILGTPRNTDSTSFEYLVIEKYERDIDPEHYQYLIIEFDSNGKSHKCSTAKR
ncbi:MAG: hypothetical protein ACPGVD_01080 [Flavobacteriales bacterium]